jgi:hypothetical protein
MINKRECYLKKGDELTMPATLFLYVLKVLKDKNSFDSIRTGKFEIIIRNIFGDKYVDNNWENIKPYLINLGYLIIFSGFVEKDELYQFIKITDKGEWLITNGVPGEWCKNTIEIVIKNYKIKD